ncbi:MAG: hypothetical protein L0Y80_04250 [Ignavibacteriae bacterium]|nr:hypothetical protein [Ignavibacteriota bacterium]
MRNGYGSPLFVCTLIAGFFIAPLTLSANSVIAVGDTVEIDPTKVNTNVLIPGTHRYLVYFQMGKDKPRVRYQMWTRAIDVVKYQGKDAISVTQEWEDSGAVVHTVYTVCDRKTFQTLYQKGWWKGRETTTFDFVKGDATIDGAPFDEKTDSANIKRWKAFQQAAQQYTLNWHLDLEVFPTLPFQDGRTFLIPYYDPGLSAPSKEAYTVIGSGTLFGCDSQKIDCWLLQKGDMPGYNATFWISKKTKEVLKLEEEFGGRFRYKIKLGFSV